MRLLVSVRSVDEALLAARGGADWIDLKEPGAGALGALPLATIAEIVAALRAEGITLPVSATIGDMPMDALPAMLDRVEAVAACGVKVVKVGIEATPRARDVLSALAACARPVAPVFIADKGLDMALVEHAASLGFAAAMADTADKHAGSLFDVASMDTLQSFVHGLRAAGLPVGLAGALRASQAPALAILAPDFAGFRSAVCANGRASALDATLLRELRDALQCAAGRRHVHLAAQAVAQGGL